MFHDVRLQSSNALTLQWHAGASTIGFEAFQAWALTALKPHLPFDAAIWGLRAEADATHPARVNSTHLHRVADGVMDRFEHLRAHDLDPAREGVIDTSLADAAWHDAAHHELRAHGTRFGLVNCITMQFVDGNAPGRQFVMLARSSEAQRFEAHEAQQFEWLAPHLMQAFATCRRQLLDASQGADRRLAGLAVAMVDRAGDVHDLHAGFLPMLRREWSDWPGTRLPEPMRDVITRRGGAPWRFLGTQVCADFAPVGDLYLVTARPRHAADPLTPRESDVARRYAAGGSFREIATSLQLSPATVRSHLRNVFGKMHVRSKAQLASRLR